MEKTSIFVVSPPLLVLWRAPRQWLLHCSRQNASSVLLVDRHWMRRTLGRLAPASEEGNGAVPDPQNVGASLWWMTISRRLVWEVAGGVGSLRQRARSIAARSMDDEKTCFLPAPLVSSGRVLTEFLLARVYCLVRGKIPSHCVERVVTACESLHVDVDATAWDRIVGVPGDVIKLHFGLSATGFDELLLTIDTVHMLIACWSTWSFVRRGM